MEGFCRQLPLLASWLASGRAPSLLTFDGKQADLREIISRGIRSGVMPGRGFWGEVGDFCQRSVEAHDVALSAWLLKSWLGSLLNPEEIRSLAQWLERAAKKNTPTPISSYLHVLLMPFS